MTFGRLPIACGPGESAPIGRRLARLRHYLKANRVEAGLKLRPRGKVDRRRPLRSPSDARGGNVTPPHRSRTCGRPAWRADFRIPLLAGVVHPLEKQTRSWRGHRAGGLLVDNGDAAHRSRAHPVRSPRVRPPFAGPSSRGNGIPRPRPARDRPPRRCPPRSITTTVERPPAPRRLSSDAANDRKSRLPTNARAAFAACVRRRANPRPTRLVLFRERGPAPRELVQISSRDGVVASVKAVGHRPAPDRMWMSLGNSSLSRRTEDFRRRGSC